MSTSNKGEKQYGLIIPKKQQPVAPKASNIFADDDDSDEEDGTDWVKKALKAESEKNKIKKQTKLSMQRALKEDPTIYQYDEVYDNMEQTKNQLKVPKEEAKKPKYIQNLLKAADRRKKEQEHRIERMVQKEREAEGAMYADKESFVTSAYRAKLEEFKKMEEEESRMDRLEAIGDVTKQQDMSGFYRHLYEQTVETPKETPNVDENNEKCEMEDTKDNREKDQNSSKEIEEFASSKEKLVSAKTKRVRQYRQRVVEEEESEPEIEVKHNAENKTTVPSPTKNDSVNKDDPEEPESKKRKQVEECEPSKVVGTIVTDNLSNVNGAESTSHADENDVNANKPATIATVKVAVDKREKTKIWEKRTIGPVFEAALQRYYTRKAARLSVA